MQELMFYFLQQNRLRFMLIWYTKPIKLHMQNRHNKNCKHVLFLESYFFHLDILWEKTFSCTDKSIFIGLYLFKKLWKQVLVLTRAMLWVCSNNRLQQKSCFLYVPTQSIYTMWRMIISNKVEKNYTNTFRGRKGIT